MKIIEGNTYKADCLVEPPAEKSNGITILIRTPSSSLHPRQAQRQFSRALTTEYERRLPTYATSALHIPASTVCPLLGASNFPRTLGASIFLLIPHPRCITDPVGQLGKQLQPTFSSLTLVLSFGARRVKCRYIYFPPLRERKFQRNYHITRVNGPCLAIVARRADTPGRPSTALELVNDSEGTPTPSFVLPRAITPTVQLCEETNLLKFAIISVSARKLEIIASLHIDLASCAHSTALVGADGPGEQRLVDGPDGCYDWIRSRCRLMRCSDDCGERTDTLEG
ncbi:hypothetical protein D9757_010269 [Collybiopsis confluens]|uniref:Uncharacterized protein n=1 Tax=Collybiopsis confluens TaxID=2823264 RepID=A0A8H5M440_9AGAR|nr:hypothetical protein D9757_010269 [Collybiopsis confluens]